MIRRRIQSLRRRYFQKYAQKDPPRHSPFSLSASICIIAGDIQTHTHSPATSKTMLDSNYGSVEICSLSSPSAIAEERNEEEISLLSQRRSRTRRMLLMFFSAIAAIFVVSASTSERNNPIMISMVNEDASLFHQEAIVNSSHHSIPTPTATPAIAYFEEFSWQKIEDEYDGSVYYLGFLEFCSIGEKQFFYRTASSANSSLPCGENATASPVIRIVPRTNYKLILINRSHQPTNLHTHGLHVAGVGMVDDVSGSVSELIYANPNFNANLIPLNHFFVQVTRNVDPGNCLEFHYRIKDNADVGTFWYHSHRHPIAAKQVGGGAYGMLIVEPSSYKRYPSHLQSLFQNEILLQYASMLDKKTQTRTNLLNGKPEALNITMDSNDYYYVRVSFVVISDAINYLQFVPSHACEARPMAYDGVYRSSLPHSQSSDKHMMTTSSRLDLAVQCHEDATIIFHQGSLSEGAKLVNIEVSNENDNKALASPFWNVTNQSFWHPWRPYYMPDLADVNTNFWKVATWNVSMDDSTNNMNGTVAKEVSINQIRWDPAIAIRQFRIGHLVEWTLINTGKHPFHIHINRMQIVQEGGCGYRYEEGEYYDTIASDAPCRIRMQFWDFAGRIVAHCHKLKHEDSGMMVWIDVTGGIEHGVNGTNQTQCSDF